MIFVADPANLSQYLQLGCPGPLHQGRNIEPGTDLIFKKRIGELHVVHPPLRCNVLWEFHKIRYAETLIVHSIPGVSFTFF